MCGRINVSDHAGVQALLDQLGISLDAGTFHPRYNIAPGEDILVAFNGNSPELARMSWGIVPAWARTKPGSRPLINARLETAWEKPSFRKMMAHSRGVVPVTGFYEWKQAGSVRQPYFIRPAAPIALALAAIYQIAKDGTRQVAILTEEAAGSMTQIHHRQPVILAPQKMKTWLTSEDRQAIEAVTAGQLTLQLDIIGVSSYVNNTANEGEECIRPAAAR